MRKKNSTYKDLAEFKNVIDPINIFNTKKIDKVSRHEKFMKQREDYGFDERETWNMGYTSILWLYAHLKRYKKWTPIELYDKKYADEYLINIIRKDENGIYLYDKVKTTYNNEYTCSDIVFKKDKKRLTCGFIIDEICEYFEYYIKNYNDANNHTLAITIAGEGVNLYGQILESLCW